MGIDAGLSGNIYQSIGTDLPLSWATKEAHLYAVAQDSLSDKDPFAWDAYPSAENSEWALTTNTASFGYSRTLRGSEISSARASSRYSEVVNTAHDGCALDATENEVYDGSILGGDVDGDGNVEVADSISALQVLSGLIPGDEIKEADVNVTLDQISYGNMIRNGLGVRGKE